VGVVIIKQKKKEKEIYKKERKKEKYIQEKKGNAEFVILPKRNCRGSTGFSVTAAESNQSTS
jgi:hypothetical protein